MGLEGHEMDRETILKEDFRIVETDIDKFIIERRVVDTHYTWWGKKKGVVKWIRCDSSGNVYRGSLRGTTYWHPVPEKPFASLSDAERCIEKIIERINNYPKIYEPR